MTQTLSSNTQAIIESRYSWKDTDGKPYESWPDIAHRIALYVSEAEKTPELRGIWYRKFLNVIEDRVFIPNTPCIVNAGKARGQAMLAACFVLPVEDRLESILETAKNAGLIHRSGGGTGFSFEKLRPAGARLSSGGTASGPISFMEIFNTITETIKQGGVRRGANMAVMRVDHPSILEFIHMKNNQDRLTNFNISVSVTDEFMKAVENKEWYQTKFNGKDWVDAVITDPLTNEVYLADVNGNKTGRVGMLYAPDVWRRIIESAHGYAEPGVIFIDTVNKSNRLKNTLGDILTSNPCGEQMLHSNNACNLGSIDLSKLVENGKFQYTKFARVIETAVRFLDNVIDVCDWPLPQIKETVERTRPIGLGVMGFADALIKMKIRYGSKESLRLAETIGSYLKYQAWNYSHQLGLEKGVFPDFFKNQDIYMDFFGSFLTKFSHMAKPRNYQVTTIAPTGTISLIAETSSGIEPNFEWRYTRKDSIGERTYMHPLVDAWYKENNPLAELPDYFVTAHELSAEDHVRMLAAWQPYIDNSISKTCNGASTDTVEDVDKLYRLAHSLGVKAVSYYRDGSREGQVLSKIETKGGDPVSQPDGAVSESDLLKGELAEYTNLNKDAVKDLVGQVLDMHSKPNPYLPDSYKELLDNQQPKPIVGQSFSHTVIPVDKPKHRPQVLTGSTWKFKLGEHEPLYITVNHDGGTIQEVFAVGPISPSVGLLISKMLRKGFSVSEVIHILRKKSGPYTVWFNQKCATTPEQLIAECLDITANAIAEADEADDYPYDEPFDDDDEYNNEEDWHKGDIDITEAVRDAFIDEIPLYKTIVECKDVTSKGVRIPIHFHPDCKPEHAYMFVRPKGVETVQVLGSYNNIGSVLTDTYPILHTARPKPTAGTCPECLSELQRKEGCLTCTACGYSKCG